MDDVVHTVLPATLTARVDAVLRDAGIEHVAHVCREGSAVLAAATSAAADRRASALIGPYRSRDVAEVVEVTAPTGLPLLAPVATAAAVTRDDEPGCEDPARHRGTVLRLPARDTVVAQRVAAVVRATGAPAFVVAGDNEYGVHLDGQLRLADLLRTTDPADAGVVVLAGLRDSPETAQAAALAPLPVIAFDGVQGAGLGAGRDVRLALPAAPVPGVVTADLLAGTENARRAALLVAGVLRNGATGRRGVLAGLRAAGGFDEHGDPPDPPVWLWRADDDWTLRPERAI